MPTECLLPDNNESCILYDNRDDDLPGYTYALK